MTIRRRDILLLTAISPALQRVGDIASHLALGRAAVPAAPELSAPTPASSLVISSDFPGGNVIVDKIEADAVFLRPNPKGGAPDWFYWYFSVQNARDRTITFRFPAKVIGVRGPAVSFDRGNTWQWLGTKSVVGDSFTYYFPEGSPEIRFSVGMPYVEANFQQLLNRFPRNRSLKRDVLCRSEQGREVDLLQLGALDVAPKYHVLITARHHACEMMASYAVEGLVEGVLSEDESGNWVRKNVGILVVPFVDKDGVEAGDQGKGRSPHDHNRDYKGQPIYASVRALKEYVPQWAQSGLDFALDIHCPTLRGGLNEELSFIATPFPENWRRVQSFCQTLEVMQQGPLHYCTENNLLYGQDWNENYSYADFDSWAVGLAGNPITTTLELPYSNVGGQPVTAESARSLGRDLATALRRHLPVNRSCENG